MRYITSKVLETLMMRKMPFSMKSNFPKRGDNRTRGGGQIDILSSDSMGEREVHLGDRYLRCFSLSVVKRLFFYCRGYGR